MTVAIHASGPFEVKLAPQPHADGVGDPGVGRMSIDKQFHGQLEGTSRGQLLGLAGTMTIVIAGAKHSYEFDYTLPETP